MHRAQKFIEDGAARIGYALTAATLAKAAGGRWKHDPSFNVADSILNNPEFVSVLRAVLSDGHVIVAEPAKGK